MVGSIKILKVVVLAHKKRSNDLVRPKIQTRFYLLFLPTKKKEGSIFKSESSENGLSVLYAPQSEYYYTHRGTLEPCAWWGNKQRH